MIESSSDLFGAQATAGPLHLCPNPKPSSADKASFGRLASLYTAFSTEFASFAVEFCIARGHRRIGDPFAGMGTLGEAARGNAVALSLNDLNPFAVTSCCMRTSSAAEIARAVDHVHALSSHSQGESDEIRFDLLIRELLPAGMTLQMCFDMPGNEATRHLICCLHILSTARIAMHKKLKGSNPTWTKRATAKIGSDINFDEALETVSRLLLHYAAQLPVRVDGFSSNLSNRNVADLNWAEGSLDAIVTSPPYPNRTDYIRHYLPAAELLLGGDRDAERHLREIQIGTPLIRQDHQNIELPSSVEAVIERVRMHDSYASQRYYAKGFRYYFEDMGRCFGQFQRWLAPNGIAMVVVQDTYYKEILVPVADLLADIADGYGLSVLGMQRFKVSNAMSRLSPHSRAAIPKPQLSETVLLLGKR